MACGQLSGAPAADVYNAALENPSVWNEPKRAQELGREKKLLESVVGTIDHLRGNLDEHVQPEVFFIDPNKKVRAVITYPASTGRNFDEVLRVIDSLQLTSTHKVATPVNWRPGEDVIIAGSVSDDEAKTIYPGGWKSPKPYIRIVPQPK